MINPASKDTTYFDYLRKKERDIRQVLTWGFHHFLLAFIEFEGVMHTIIGKM